MHHRQHIDHLHFAVIGKTSAHIWGDGIGEHSKPVAVHDPRSRPHLGAVSGPHATSNYDMRELAQGSRAKFSLIPGWVKPSLDTHYCELIYKRLKDCDRVFIVGGGVGRWSGVNNFMTYIAERHSEFNEKVEYRVYFRLTDFPESKLRKIFHEMSEEGSFN